MKDDVTREYWRCEHDPRCADSVCAHNPAMQRWVDADGKCRACGGEGCIRCDARQLPPRPAHRTNPGAEESA